MKAIITKYHGPTNTRGSRIWASDCDGNRASVAYDDGAGSESGHFQAVRALCRKMDWRGKLVCGSLRGSQLVWVWVFEGNSTLWHVSNEPSDGPYQEESQ